MSKSTSNTSKGGVLDKTEETTCVTNPFAASPQIPERKMCATFAERMLAFASGLHPDVGAESPVQLLSPELTRMILSYARPPTLVTASLDRTARVWDLETGQCKAVCKGHRNNILCVETSANRVYTGSSDTTVKVWDARTGECIGTMRDSKHHVLALRVIRELEVLISGSRDCNLYVYDMFNLSLVTKVPVGSPVYSLAYDEFSRQLLVGSGSGLIMRYDPTTWKQVGEPVVAHSSDVSLLRIGNPLKLPDRDKPFRTLISMCSMTSTVTLWNLETWETISSLSFPDEKPVDAYLAEYTCSGEQWLLVGTQGGEVLEFNPFTREFSRNITPKNSSSPISCLMLAPWPDVDLGNAWYADEAFIRDFLKPQIHAVSLRDLNPLHSSAQNLAALLEHEKEEKLALAECSHGWNTELLGPCSLNHSARLLAVAYTNGTCGIFDYPNGKLVFTIPPLKSDSGHSDSITAITLLELDAFHDFF